MKAIQRGVMSILPGKMPEAMELMKKHMAVVTRMGMDPSKMRSYRYAMGGEVMRTMIFEYEWESLTKLADFFEKMMEDPEMVDLMTKWQAVLEYHTVEILSPIP